MNFAASDHTLHRVHSIVTRRSERNERSTLEEIPLSPKNGDPRRKTSGILGRKHVSALLALLLTAVSVWNYQAHINPYDDRVHTHQADQTRLSIAEPSGVTVPSTSAAVTTVNATVLKPPLASVKVVKQAGITTAETAAKKLAAMVNLETDPDGLDFHGLWNGPDLYHYPDGSKIPAQARRHCKPLFLAASSISGIGVVAEFGPWVGHSSRCIGAGLNTSGFTQRLYSYDAFNDPINANKLKGTKYASNTEAARHFKFIWEETVWPVYPSAKAIEGRLENTARASSWAFPVLEMFVIDTAKTHDHFLNQAPLGWKHLAVGSLLVLMDFVKTPQVEVLYAQFVRTGALEVIYMDFCASPWMFAIRKPLPWARVKEFQPTKYSDSEWKSIFQGAYADVDRLAKQYKVKSQADIDCVKNHLKERESRVTGEDAHTLHWRMESHGP